MRVAAVMTEKLNRAFAPTMLDVTDESAAHAGHAGAGPGGQTHFHVRMVSAAFEGVTRVERQRRVHAALAAEIAGGVHALSLSLATPREAAASSAA
jgi:BolA protein